MFFFKQLPVMITVGNQM